ncbi:MAG TPA: efflux transporter outer membrane subunit [Burkholderiaceae bacterium]|jgi:NodT family efflux transporter outer membrane factor (OMF) lipoprotein
MRLATIASAAALAALLAGCVAGPNYVKPTLPMPADWKTEAPWRTSAPDDAAAKGPWWQRFGDSQLNALQEQALANNPTLTISVARLTQARATLQAVSASRYPQLGITTRAQRLDISANRPLTNYAAPNFSTVQNDFIAALTVGYEVDVAGRVSRSVEGARASAEQSAADLENTRLLLGADLATAYFNLREIDIEVDVLNRSIALQQRAFELIDARHELGAATGLDVAQQQALLDTTKVQIDVLARQRLQYEHAIATLTGAAAPTFAIAPLVRDYVPPVVPIGVPSDVLERRPDVASAERAMAAANAQIGVAKSAFYPSVLLGPQIGVESNGISTLFNATSLLWSFGVSATQVLFDGGRLNANVDFARAGYDATVANYRRVVLGAMQEVEDGITGGAALERAYVQAQAAVASARRVLEMATARYDGGATTYLDVITAQQALLVTERQSAQLLGQRLLTSVFLVKALGGDYQPARVAAAKPAS